MLRPTLLAAALLTAAPAAAEMQNQNAWWVLTDRCIQLRDFSGISTPDEYLRLMQRHRPQLNLRYVKGAEWAPDKESPGSAVIMKGRTGLIIFGKGERTCRDFERICGVPFLGACGDIGKDD